MQALREPSTVGSIRAGWTIWLTGEHALAPQAA